MVRLKLELRRFLLDEQGQSTTEYILILSVVVMVALKFKKEFEGKLGGIISKLGSGIDSSLDQSLQ